MLLCSSSQITSSSFATISCCFNPWQHRKKPGFAISLSSFPFSTSCSASQSDTFRSTTITKSWKNEVKMEIRVSSKDGPIRSKLVPSRRPFWRKGWFKSKKIKSVLLLNVITIVYASNISIVKDVEAFMDPAAFSAVRFVVSAIPFLPFVFRARNDVQTRNAGIELGLYVSLGYLIEALGLVTSDAGRTSFISLFTVIVVPLLESMLGAIIPARTWFGVLMSVLGVAMLESSGSPPCVGDLLNFLSAIFFGIHTLRTEQLSRSTKTENFLPLLGYEIAALQDVSATETAIIYGLEPLWGAGFAWFLLGERWGTVGWIGAAFVLGGSLMVQILGSSSCESTEADDYDKKDELLVVSNKQKPQANLSTSPVVLRSRKDLY